MNRVSMINGHLRPSKVALSHMNDEGLQYAVSKPALRVVDSRTDNEYSISIRKGTVNAQDFAQIRVPGEPGLVVYDPGQMNTAVCSSKITYIDGEKGILRYRGYPIEALAEKTSFEECAFLLMYGELPTADQLAAYTASLKSFSVIPTNLRKLIKTFKPDAHPMGMLMSCLAAAGTCYPEANPCVAGEGVLKDPLIRNKHLLRVLAMTPTLAANIQRFREGMQLVNADPDLGFTAGFLAMLDRKDDRRCLPHPVLVRALDILFVLHADHELNCSTAAVRHVASSNADIYTAMAAATGALYGPRHGGANEAVVRMLERIGSAAGVPAFIKRVKDRKERLMGFGHRVYKSYDPRAHIIRKVADVVFEVVGASPLIFIAKELEQAALKDKDGRGSLTEVTEHFSTQLAKAIENTGTYLQYEDPYFTSRRLYPNVDFYSGVIYKAMGFPVDFFPLLFAVPRMAGWVAHFCEFTEDKENRIARPLQIYLGHGLRSDVPPIDTRPKLINDSSLHLGFSLEDRRRRLSCYPTVKKVGAASGAEDTE